MITIQRLQHTRTIDMRCNPFQCTCDLILFKKWLLKTNISVIGPTDCEGPPERKGTSITDFPSSTCTSQRKLLIFSVSGCKLLSLLMCTLFYVIYKYRKRRKLDKLDYCVLSQADKEAHIQYNFQSEIELQSKKEWIWTIYVIHKKKSATTFYLRPSISVEIDISFFVSCPLYIII